MQIWPQISLFGWAQAMRYYLISSSILKVTGAVFQFRGLRWTFLTNSSVTRIIIATWRLELPSADNPLTICYRPCCSREQCWWGQHRAHLGPCGPRWAPCFPHEPCYQGCAFCGRMTYMSDNSRGKQKLNYLTACKVTHQQDAMKHSLQMGTNQTIPLSTIDSQSEMIET